MLKKLQETSKLAILQVKNISKFTKNVLEGYFNGVNQQPF